MKKISFPTLLACAFCASFQFVACEQDNSIPVADLPPAIKTYVEANYPGYSIDEAVQETLCSGESAYDVEIEQGEENEASLSFDAEGNFLYSETDITIAELPTAIVNSIASNYSGFKTEEVSKLTMADGSTQYEVELEKGSTDKEVLYDSEGTVICEQDGE